MKITSSLSTREKQHQFVYLLSMVGLAIILFMVVLLKKFDSPLQSLMYLKHKC